MSGAEHIPGNGELADIAQLWTLGNPAQLDPTDMLTSAQLAYDQAMDRGNVDDINAAEQRLVSIYDAHPELRAEDNEPKTQRKGRATFLYGLGDPDKGTYIDF